MSYRFTRPVSILIKLRLWDARCSTPDIAKISSKLSYWTYGPILTENPEMEKPRYRGLEYRVQPVTWRRQTKSFVKTCFLFCPASSWVGPSAKIYSGSQQTCIASLRSKMGKINARNPSSFFVLSSDISISLLGDHLNVLAEGRPQWHTSSTFDKY